MESNGDMDVAKEISLLNVLQNAEHIGCSSGRARAILISAESCSANTITQCPRELPARARPVEPHINVGYSGPTILHLCLLWTCFSVKTNLKSSQ